MPEKDKLVRPLKVKALKSYKIWLRYSDDTSGEIDLSELAGKGVFHLWEKEDFLRTNNCQNPTQYPGEMKLNYARMRFT